MTTKPDGILLLNKQPGMTSFDCIRNLKKIWGRTDLGHGGTLDRFASGVLPVLAGEGLKLARFFLESYPGLPTYWKSYAGTFELGVSTETGDPEGEVIERREPLNLSVATVEAAMQQFVGVPYEQLPPKYSAKKIGGSRASDLVREGKEIELKAVPVVLRSFKCTGIEGSQIRFKVECSKGTYVRSLAVDLAAKLGTVAYVSELSRTAVGGYKLSETITLEQVARIPAAEALGDLTRATSFLPSFAVIGAELEQLKVGRTDGVGARLANSGQPAGVYCVSEGTRPLALFDLTPEKRAVFLRAFKL